MNLKEEYVTIGQLAEELNVSRNTVSVWLKEFGMDVDFIKIGPTKLYPRKTIADRVALKYTLLLQFLGCSYIEGEK